MHIERWLIALLVVAFPASGGKPEPDRFTPLIASPLVGNTQPFLGTDGKWHVVYELVLTNATPTPATLQKLEVFDAHSPSAAIASYNGGELRARLRTLANTAAASRAIEFNGTRLFLIDLTFDSQDKIPGRIEHYIDVLAASSPNHRQTTPVPLSYSVAPFDLTRHVHEVGPPLAGKGWVAANGCCGIDGIHRATGLPVNGRIYFAQRFAIDWMRLDGAGRLVHGDPSDVKNYTCYGAEVMAVADGTVVETLNALNDQTPGTLPDRKTITLANVDGNHIILDLGDGVFALYAHMQKNSIRVAQGSRVKRGQVLGKLGNTGNTSAPHLHFQLMDGSSSLGSNGVPYNIDGFALAGQIPLGKFAEAKGIEGDWSTGLLSHPNPRHKQLPLDLAIVDFSAGKESAP